MIAKSGMETRHVSDSFPRIMPPQADKSEDTIAMTATATIATNGKDTNARKPCPSPPGRANSGRNAPAVATTANVKSSFISRKLRFLLSADSSGLGPRTRNIAPNVAAAPIATAMISAREMRPRSTGSRSLASNSISWSVVIITAPERSDSRFFRRSGDHERRRRSWTLVRTWSLHGRALLPRNSVRSFHPTRIMTSSQTEEGPRSGVIFDTFDTWNILGRQPQGMAFLLGLHNSPEVNDAISHDDIFVEQMRPALRLKLGNKPHTNGTVINACRFNNIGRRQSLQQVTACHNADELAILDHRDAFDPMLLQNLCDFGERNRRSDCDHVESHNLPSDVAVRLDVIMGQSALADDPDHAFFSIDHRHATDSPRIHQFRDVADRGLWCDTNDVGRHNVGCCQHGFPPASSSSACQE